MAVGAVDAFADCLRFGTHPFLADEAMRNQVMCLLTMSTWRIVQLYGLLVDGLKVGIIALHDGAGIEKDANSAVLNFYEKICLGELAL